MEGSYQAKPQNSLWVFWPREDSSKVTEEKEADASSYRRASTVSQDLSLHPDYVILDISLSLPKGKIRYCMGRDSVRGVPVSSNYWLCVGSRGSGDSQVYFMS